MMYVAIGILAAVGVLLYLMRRDTYRNGKGEEKIKSMEEMLESVSKAKKANSAIKSDPSLRDKLHHRKDSR